MGIKNRSDLHTVVRVAAHAACDPRTAQRFLDTNDRLKPVSEVACRRACAELGIPVPPARMPKQGGAK